MTSIEPTEGTAWPETPCPPVSLALRSTLALLERTALQLATEERADFERWLKAWLTDVEEKPSLMVLGAGLLAISSRAIVKLKDDREARCVAYHEAGHVVMAVLSEVPVTSVTINASPVDGYLGCCRFEGTDLSDNDRHLAEANALVSLAGPIAEGMAGYLPPCKDLERHHRDAIEDVRHAGPFNGEAELEAHVAYLRERAIGMLLHHWVAVTALADELISRRTIEGGEAERIVIDVLKRAEFLPAWLAWRVDE